MLPDEDVGGCCVCGCLQFFQGQDNSQWNDYVSWAFVAALMYFVFKAFAELNKLG